MTETADSTRLTMEEALPVLGTTPSFLGTLVEALPAEWLDFKEDPEAWSPRMVLVHLIHNERTNWIPRAKVILSKGDDRKFAPFEQMPPPGEAADGDVGAMIDEFASLREQSLMTLRGFGLRSEDYLRTGEHPVLGTVTLSQLLATWVVHDLNHCHQILKSLAKRQTTAVGPWRKYLGILDL